MALTFRVADGIWYPELDAVRFFAGDDGKLVVFSVSRAALTSLEAGAAPGNPLSAYDKHLLRIRDVARMVYDVSGRTSTDRGVYDVSGSACPGNVVALEDKYFI